LPPCWPGSPAHRSSSGRGGPPPCRQSTAELEGPLLETQESEGDLLPFALDADSGLAPQGDAVGGSACRAVVPLHQPQGPQLQAQQPYPGFAYQGYYGAPQAGLVGSIAPGGAAELESAVGAFIRLLQEAPPLASAAAAGGGLTLAAGLAQLDEAGRQVQLLLGHQQ
jgi:hypothetical protein